MTGILIYVASVVIAAIIGAVPLIIKGNKAKKAEKMASTDVEKEKAETEMLKAKSEMREYLLSLIVQAEKNYSILDKVMKTQQNSSAGGIKKESVFTKLQSYALSKGFDFDGEFWSNAIDELISFTKQVNFK